jgi:hypothetical protein
MKKTYLSLTTLLLLSFLGVILVQISAQDYSYTVVKDEFLPVEVVDGVNLVGEFDQSHILSTETLKEIALLVADQTGLVGEPVSEDSYMMSLDSFNTVTENYGAITSQDMTLNSAVYTYVVSGKIEKLRMYGIGEFPESTVFDGLSITLNASTGELYELMAYLATSPRRNMKDVPIPSLRPQYILPTNVPIPSLPSQEDKLFDLPE